MAAETKPFSDYPEAFAYLKEQDGRKVVIGGCVVTVNYIPPENVMGGEVLVGVNGLEVDETYQLWERDGLLRHFVTPHLVAELFNGERIRVQDLPRKIIRPNEKEHGWRTDTPMYQEGIRKCLIAGVEVAERVRTFFLTSIEAADQSEE